MAINSLTDVNLAPVGLANIVIWGYSEVGVGMFVGCLATLRPLFRRVFRLRSEPTRSKSKLSGAFPGSFPNKFNNNNKTTHRRDKYDQFSPPDDMELGGLGSTTRATASSPLGTRASHVSDDADSMKQILREGNKHNDTNLKGIVVSRQVNVARSGWD